jgi:hypothetical protein
VTTAANAERWRHTRHLSQSALYAYYLATAALPWLPNPPRWLSAIVTLTLLGILYAIWKHNAELCERCIARMPLNPQSAVDKHRTKLRIHHQLVRWFVVWLAATITGDVMPQHWIATKCIQSAATLSCLFVIYAIAVHNRLQPWCPFCPRDDGDDDAADVPDPVDGNRKPIPA